MTRHHVRTSLVFLLTLGVLAAGIFALQQRFYTRGPVQDLTPGTAGLPGPVPLAQPASQQARAKPGPPVVDGRWLATTARRTGIPEAALQAYARAELRRADGCRVGWSTLAGIGWIESQHGTLGGRTLGVDGRSSTRILGPALDGRDGVRAIRATASSTAWHGDPQWDHALGPMQFIPSTWASWASDGDGDGTRDPHDLDDAAQAAARYLCADGRDLTTAEGWSGGVLSYNQSQEYVVAVHAAASTYADRARR